MALTKVPDSLLVNPGGGGGGATDHGALTGLADDDHSQYHTDTRGDIRYYTKSLLDGGQLNTLYYTQAQVSTQLAGKSNTGHGHDDAEIAAAASATNYSPGTATVDGHLSAIDVAFTGPIAHGSSTSNPHGVTKAQVGLADVENIKVHLTATVDPTQNEDSDDGYSVGSRWINTVANREFVCLNATPFAAVWTETTGAAGGGTAPNTIEITGSAVLQDGFSHVIQSGTGAIDLPAVLAQNSWVFVANSTLVDQSIRQNGNLIMGVDAAHVLGPGEQAVFSWQIAGSWLLSVGGGAGGGSAGVGFTVVVAPTDVIPASESVTITVAVVGAVAATDVVAWVHEASPNEDVRLVKSWVSAADTVSLKYMNDSAMSDIALIGDRTVRVERVK